MLKTLSQFLDMKVKNGLGVASQKQLKGNGTTTMDLQQLISTDVGNTLSISTNDGGIIGSGGGLNRHLQLLTNEVHYNMEFPDTELSINGAIMLYTTSIPDQQGKGLIVSNGDTLSYIASFIYTNSSDIVLDFSGTNPQNFKRLNFSVNFETDYIKYNPDTLFTTFMYISAESTNVSTTPAIKNLDFYTKFDQNTHQFGGVQYGGGIFCKNNQSTDSITIPAGTVFTADFLMSVIIDAKHF